MLRQIETHPNYAISNQGYVLNIKTGKTKKLQTKNNGYLGIVLFNKHKGKNVLLHRLLAQAFIPNPKNKPCVNHIDGNRQNNNLSNLEWCTHQENMRHALETGLKELKPVQGTCIKTGEKIKFPSVIEADRNGFYKANISDCCNGKRKTHLGYTWEFIGE